NIFDRQLYKSLLSKELIKNERDIILSRSLDRYQIFYQQQDNNWIIMFINNNIPPEDHVKQENLLIAAIIPGPKSPKDFNSFMYPIIEYYAKMVGNKKILFYAFLFQFGVEIYQQLES
ncbi:11993_t:CDS:2, partial [Gigaspora margarita]